MRVTPDGPETGPGAPPLESHIDFHDQDHPPASEGVLVAGSVTNTVDQIYEIHGEVSVGRSTTHYKGYFPENRTQDGLGYLFHGFIGFLKSSEPLGRAYAERGLANIVVDQSHLSNSLVEDLTDSQALHVETAEAVFSDLKHNGQVLYVAPEGRKAVSEQWLVSAHSMGGLASARFVEAHPDETESLALLKTVGVNDSIISQLIKSIVDGTAIGGGRHELLPYLLGDSIELSPRNLARIARYVGLGWPLLNDRRPSRAVGEMLSCLTANTRESLTTIGSQGTARIGIEAGRDALVRFAPDIRDYLDRLIVFEKYGHMMPQYRPGLIAETVLKTRQEMRTEVKPAA